MLSCPPKYFLQVQFDPLHDLFESERCACARDCQHERLGFVRFRSQAPAMQTQEQVGGFPGRPLVAVDEWVIPTDSTENERRPVGNWRFSANMPLRCTRECGGEKPSV